MRRLERVGTTIRLHPRAPAFAPSLRRCLSTAGVLFLTLSVATPASSVFVIVPGMLQIAGTGALLALMLAGLVCIATAFIYAELSSAWPVAGGEYVMVARTLGPCAGFAMLGVNVFNNLLFPPVAALGVAAVSSTFVPGLPTVPVAVAVMVAATFLGILNVRLNAVVTGGFLLVETAVLAIIVAFGAMRPVRPLGVLLLHPVMANGAALMPASAASIGVATSIAIFALNGYGAAVYFGEEMEEAPSRIASAILLALVATLVLEALPVAAGLMATRDLPGFLSAANPFGDFVDAAGGGMLGGWAGAGIVVAIVNAVIAGILATARFLYATARDRSWGGRLDALLGTIHPRAASPIGATLVSGAIGIAACFVPLRILLVLSGAGLIAIYAGLTASVVLGRMTGATAHAQYRMPLYPVAPISAAAALAYVLWFNCIDIGDGRLGVVATFAQIVASVGYYHLVLKRRRSGCGASQIGIPPNAT